MSCPNAQVLSRYYDEMIVGDERRQMTKHITSCTTCQHVLLLYEAEAQFIWATLREPSLPAYFVEDVLCEVMPRKKWKWLQFICVLFLVIVFMAVFVCAAVVR